MVRNSRRAVVSALMIVGCLGAARAAPIAPGAMAAPTGSAAKTVSFWGQPFPSGYAYFPRECYMHVLVDTPHGPVWRRVFICTETGIRGFTRTGIPGTGKYGRF